MQRHDPIVTGYFNFDPLDPIYGDHFPGNPIVPGSLIIHAFMVAKGNADMGASTGDISRFRFKHFVSPGRYAYRMETRSDGRVTCFLYDDQRTLVTGTL